MNTLDHGTLRDENGEPLRYRTDPPNALPLAQSMIWPDDMSDSDAAFFARRVAGLANQRLGFEPCDADGMSHSGWVLVGHPCPSCGAAL